MKNPRIEAVEVIDLRFPTSDSMDGSDAVHVDPDYSAAYVRLRTDAPGLEGNGIAFTIGRGNELCAEAVRSLAPMVRGRSLHDFTRDFGAAWRALANDSQLRWVGPEKGVIHLALAAVVNAIWDLWAKAEGKPFWRLVCDLTPEELVRTIDFRYLTDALAPDDFRRGLPRFQGDGLRHNRRLVACLDDVAREVRATPAQVALAWLLSRGPNVVPIVGMRNALRVRENVAACNLILPAALQEQLNELFAPGVALGGRYAPAAMAAYGLNE